MDQCPQGIRESGQCGPRSSSVVAIRSSLSSYDGAHAPVLAIWAVHRFELSDSVSEATFPRV